MIGLYFLIFQIKIYVYKICEIVANTCDEHWTERKRQRERERKKKTTRALWVRILLDTAISTNFSRVSPMQIRMYNIRRDIWSFSLFARANNTVSRYMYNQRASEWVFCSACAEIRPRIAVSFYLKSRDDFSIPPVLRLIVRARSTLASLSVKTRAIAGSLLSAKENYFKRVKQNARSWLLDITR